MTTPTISLVRHWTFRRCGQNGAALPGALRRRSLPLLLLSLLVSTTVWAQETAPAETPESGVKPGINDRWMSDDVEGLVASLERDGREIFDQREPLADLVASKPGMRIADIGAGSGFMAEAFARRVGEEGKIYAVDINEKMMERVAEKAKELGISNLATVVCTPTSVELPASSVDLVFLADTYHHLEHPSATLESIRQALAPGGEMVVVDFEREAGVSAEWVMNHVRLDKGGVIAEVVANGFELVEEMEAPFLKENFALRFRSTRR